MAEQPVLAITGASRGIGLGMAEYFTNCGYKVAGCSRGQSQLAAENYFHALVDITEESDVIQWIRSVKKKYGRLDILVCNAAIVPKAALLLASSRETMESVLSTNVTGTYLVCREAAKAMLLQRTGRIITVSSMAVGLYDMGTSIYASSKSAVVEITKILAKELASSGITCNVVSPSVFLSSAKENLGESQAAEVLERLTIKRSLTIEEICKVIEFFAASESSCITGQVLQLGMVV